PIQSLLTSQRGRRFVAASGEAGPAAPGPPRLDRERRGVSRSTTPTLGETDDLARQVGRRVRALRKARGLGEADIEARLFNFKYLQRIEAGQVNLTLRT